MTTESLIKDQLKRTLGYEHYNGWENSRTSYGYHSFNLPGVNILGQRTPVHRLDEFRKHIDFTNKTVVDIGCNVGGMLFHLDEIKKGYGFDFDATCIDVAKNISKILKNDKLEFNTVDLDSVPHSTLNNYFKSVDIVFLLAVNKWIKTHLELFDFFIKQECDIVLELNNNKRDQDIIKFFESKGLTPVKIISGSPDDNTKDNKKARATYLIRNATS
jgi:SAM-dependent methyltransferase